MGGGSVAGGHTERETASILAPGNPLKQSSVCGVAIMYMCICNYCAAMQCHIVGCVNVNRALLGSVPGEPWPPASCRGSQHSPGPPPICIAHSIRIDHKHLLS